MSFNASALKLMADKGLTAHDIAEVAAANECSGDSAAERRRAWDRERKREQREAERVSGGISGGNPPDPAPNERDNLTPTHEEKAEAKASPKKFPAPAKVTDDQWRAFRSQRKKALNERSYTLLCNKLVELDDAGWPPGDMIDLAIERGWETVFAPKAFTDERSQRTNGMGRHQSPDGLSPTTRAAVAVFGAPEASH